MHLFKWKETRPKVTVPEERKVSTKRKKGSSLDKERVELLVLDKDKKRLETVI